MLQVKQAAILFVNFCLDVDLFKFGRLSICELSFAIEKCLAAGFIYRFHSVMPDLLKGSKDECYVWWR